MAIFHDCPMCGHLTSVEDTAPADTCCQVCRASPSRARLVQRLRKHWAPGVLVALLLWVWGRLLWQAFAGT